MPTDYPDHHDAEIVIKLYDLRREPVMRESRAAINRDFWPRGVDDVMAIVGNRDHPLNAPYRQTSTYWEMVFGMVKHGVVHPDLLLENSGEGIFLFARVQPFLAELRSRRASREFQNAEWVTTRTDLGRQMLEVYGARVRRMLEARA